MANGDRWTEARFRAFIISGLRSLSAKWPPKYETKKEAWVRRGIYTCAGFGRKKPHEAKARDIQVDHIDPVIDPAIGFVSFDEYVSRLFVEKDKLQVLCKECHNRKTSNERQKRKKSNSS